MPLYEYQCDACGQRFTVLSRTVQSAAEAGQPACPHCQSTATQRVVTAFAVQGGGPDPHEAAVARAAENRQAGITSREQISSWRSAKKTL